MPSHVSPKRGGFSLRAVGFGAVVLVLTFLSLQYQRQEREAKTSDVDTGGEERMKRSVTSAAKGQGEVQSGGCNKEYYWVGSYSPACSKHYFSFVLCVRNDNYGGSFQHRVRAMLQSTLTLLKSRAGSPLPNGKVFSAEILLVEYRPTSEEPQMKDIIASYVRPYLSKYLSVRVITVPGVVIETWPDPKKLIVAEYVGKNIGIRRARGEFVLAANADDILTEALVNFISKGMLDYGVYYRAPLLDPFYPPGGSDGWGNLPHDKFSAGLKDIVAGDVCKWKRKGCSYMEVPVSTCKKSFVCRAYAEERDYNGDICAAGGLRSSSKVQNHPSLKVFGIPNLAAPGDFILMSRKNWFDTGAHSEVLAHRHHFDGWMECRALFAFKIAQVNLNAPCVVLHQDHGGKKFRAMIVSQAEDLTQTGSSGKSKNVQGHFGMILNGVPKAQYRTIYKDAKHLNNADVEYSRRLTDQWIQSYRERNIKGSVLSAWDWNDHVVARYGVGHKPPAEDIVKICNKNAKGGPGERLFDGKQYHPEHFGWPEWVFPEVEFEV